MGLSPVITTVNFVLIRMSNDGCKVSCGVRKIQNGLRKVSDVSRKVSNVAMKLSDGGRMM